MSNTITITGYLGRDPELKYTGQNGLPVCEISVGATPRRKTKSGEWEDRGAAQWFKLVAFEAEAEAWAEAFNKGDKVCATGTLVVDEFTRRDGSAGYSLTLFGPTVGKVPAVPAAPYADNRRQGGGYGASGGGQVPPHGQPTFNAPQGGTVNDPWAAPQGATPPF